METSLSRSSEVAPKTGTCADERRRRRISSVPLRVNYVFFGTSSLRSCAPTRVGHRELGELCSAGRADRLAIGAKTTPATGRHAPVRLRQMMRVELSADRSMGAELVQECRCRRAYRLRRYFP